MNEIIKNILLDEFKYMNKKKECIGLICISTFSFFLLSSNYSELNKILRFVLIITPFMAIYSTIITIISKSKDVYNNLWMSIPINSYLYSFSISIIVYYRHYISKMIPLFFLIIIRNLLNMKIGIYEGILFLLILSITNYLPIILSLFIYDILRKKMKLIYKKRGKSKNSISYNNISIILL